MNARVRVPQYMHLPMQFLWFDTEEISIILVSYIVGLVFGGLAWFAMVLGPALYIPVKRRQPRGFMMHFLYRFGMAKLRGYPGPDARIFNE